MTVNIAQAARRIALTVSISSLFVATGCTKKTEKPKERPPALVMTAVASQQDVPLQLKAIGNI